MGSRHRPPVRAAGVSRGTERNNLGLNWLGALAAGIANLASAARIDGSRGVGVPETGARCRAIRQAGGDSAGARNHEDGPIWLPCSARRRPPSMCSREAQFEVDFAPKAPFRISSLKKHGENR